MIYLSHGQGKPTETKNSIQTPSGRKRFNMKDNIVKVYRAVLTVKLSEDDKRGLDYRRSPEKALHEMRHTFNEMCDDMPKKTSAFDFAEMFNKEIERQITEFVECKNTDITLLISDIIEEVPDVISKADLAKAYEHGNFDTEIALSDDIDAEILSPLFTTKV